MKRRQAVRPPSLARDAASIALVLLAPTAVLVACWVGQSWLGGGR
jgi:hypothetical protein